MVEFGPIFNSVSVPIVVLDAHLTVVNANEKARKFFPGLTVGLGVEKAISPKSGFFKQLRKALKTSMDLKTNIQEDRGIGREYLVSICPFKTGAKSDPAHLVLTFEDRSSVLDAKAMRSDFVANVSHEIRSPLTAISGFVETLQGAASDDAEARDLFLGLMANEAQRMTALVADLLSLSQVEVKERRAPKKTVNLSEILEQVHEAVKRLAGSRQKVIDFQVTQPLPTLHGKHDDLVRLFINLLENAINYGATGTTVTLTAGLAPKSNPLERPAVCVAIQDQGDGIPAEDIPRLTERFYRVDKSRSRNVGGTGLGLAIVKHILVRHRGKLVIESTVGEGSTFSAYLPLIKSAKS